MTHDYSVPRLINLDLQEGSTMLDYLLLVAYFSLVSLAVVLIVHALNPLQPVKRPKRTVYHGRSGYFNDPS